jgi:hypothetical protein
VRDFLKREEEEVWSWFAAQKLSPKYAEDVRFELLKSTYRVERQDQPALYDVVGQIAGNLGIGAPITIYQAQHPLGLNASLAYVPGEIHLVLHGPIVAHLTPIETRGLLAHELAHFMFYQELNGELLVAADTLCALASDDQAHSAHHATLRLFRLYTEIYCDRAALAISGDLHSVISMLVKVETGVQTVSAEAYLRQAAEILTRNPGATEGFTHPEAFIRARAAELWTEGQQDCDRRIAELIEGRPGIDELDLLAQQVLADQTRRLLDALLCRRWLQTDTVLAHARLFFNDYVPPPDVIADPNLSKDLPVQHASIQDYVCFLLLDFVTADRDLDELPLAAALVLAEQLQVKPRLVELARQELKLRKTQLEKLDADKDSILAAADRQAAIAT